MSKLPIWIIQFLFYGTLAAIFNFAHAGDPYADQAFCAIIILRAISCIIVAGVMNSSWYQQRDILEGGIRFASEALIAIGLIVTEHSVVAILSVLTLALYESARLRIMPRDIPQYG